MIYINAVHGLSVYRFNRGRGPRFDGISLRGLGLLLSLNRGKEAYDLREPM